MAQSTPPRPPGASLRPRWWSRDTPAYCWYDPDASADLLPAQELWNVIGRATWEWTAGQQAFVEYVFSRNELEMQLFPTVANSAQTFQKPVRYPAGGLYYPTEFATANGICPGRSTSTGGSLRSADGYPPSPRKPSGSSSVHKARLQDGRMTAPTCTASIRPKTASRPATCQHPHF